LQVISQTEGDTTLPGVVFLWENIGPTHDDRLLALVTALEGRARVTAVQFWPVSSVYEWDSTPSKGYRLRTLCRSPHAKRGLSLSLAIVRACLGERRADIYLCHYEQPAVLLAAIWLRLCGRRLITMIDSKFDDKPRKLWREVGKAFYLAPYHAALTASDRSREYLSFLGLPEHRILLGYDALSVDRIGALAQAPPAPGGTPFEARNFAVVARLVPKKNIALAIEAFAIWRARTGGTRRLRICGSGELHAALLELAERMGVADAVDFLGFVQSDVISLELGRALCLLLPSTEEQFGLVVIEALAMGVPVIVGRNAGACDTLIDVGMNGYMINPDSAEGLAALMADLSEDRARWARMATAAYGSRHRGDVAAFVASVETLSQGRLKQLR